MKKLSCIVIKIAKITDFDTDIGKTIRIKSGILFPWNSVASGLF